MVTESLKQSLKDIHFFRGVIPIDALQNLYSQKEEATPYLLKELKKAISHADKTGDYYVAHLFCLLLLAQFKEKKAYPLIIKLLELSVDQSDQLLGDMLGETIPSIVLSTYDGNVEPLFALLTNPETDDLIKYIVEITLLGLIDHQLVKKEHVLEFLEKQLTENTSEKRLGLLTMFANYLTEGSQDSLKEVVRQSINTGTQEEKFKKLKEFEAGLQIFNELIERSKDVHFIDNVGRELINWSTYTGELITPNINPEGNCPCGSGELFKNCCIDKL